MSNREDEGDGLSNRQIVLLVVVPLVLLAVVSVVAYLLRNQPVNPCCG